MTPDERELLLRLVQALRQDGILRGETAAFLKRLADKIAADADHTSPACG